MMPIFFFLKKKESYVDNSNMLNIVKNSLTIPDTCILFILNRFKRWSLQHGIQLHSNRIINGKNGKKRNSDKSRAFIPNY